MHSKLDIYKTIKKEILTSCTTFQSQKNSLTTAFWQVKYMLVSLSTARSPLWNVSINTQALLGAIVYALSATRHPSVEMSFQGGIRRARLTSLVFLCIQSQRKRSFNFGILCYDLKGIVNIVSSFKIWAACPYMISEYPMGCKMNLWKNNTAMLSFSASKEWKPETSPQRLQYWSYYRSRW